MLAILFSHTSLPEHTLEGRPEASRLGEVKTLVGRPREEKADFWTSVGGEYKASIDFVVHGTVESGATFVRGPEVRTQTIPRAWSARRPPRRPSFTVSGARSTTRTAGRSPMPG